MICLEYLHRLPSEVPDMEFEELNKAIAYHLYKNAEIKKTWQT